MRRLAIFVAVSSLLAMPSGSQPAEAAGRSTAPLVAAAKITRLDEIGYDLPACRAGMSVEAWLDMLTRGQAVHITWRGGSCRLTDQQNPLDSGSGLLCGGALLRSAKADWAGEVEISFEPGKMGKPDRAVAFRGIVPGPEPELLRFSQDFETSWRAVFGLAPDPACAEN